MAKTEKIAFILEQVRLCLEKQDFIRAQILSRKVSPKAFVERKGEAHGDIGIEGTAIEAPEAVRAGCWGEGGAEEGARESGRGGAQRDWGKDEASDEVFMKGIVIGAECGEGRGGQWLLAEGLGRGAVPWGSTCNGRLHTVGVSPSSPILPPPLRHQHMPSCTHPLLAPLSSVASAVSCRCP